jgi:hypothetical protein
MSLYLTELTDWLLAAGLPVIEYPGWQHRARGSGGYNGNPLCVMWHHTASPESWDGQKDADYIAVGSADTSPISNLYIQRDGTVWVIAAGATNTNGKGNALSFSRGTVPQDSMNSYAVGVEMGNDGLGEVWPQAQIDAIFVVSNTINQHLGNAPEDVSTHNYYAPSRKIDPATAAAVQGPWKPRSSTSSGTWHVDDIRTECRRRATSTPIPPDGEDDDMSNLRLVRNKGFVNVFLVGAGAALAISGETMETYPDLPRVFQDHAPSFKAMCFQSGLDPTNPDDLVPGGPPDQF